MKRGYKGVYHHWSKKHLHRYIDEFAFRLDKGNCDIDTIDRVKSLVQGSVNKDSLMKNLFHKEVKDILAGNFREQPLRERWASSWRFMF